MSYFVIVVDSQGIPVSLVGPVEWDHAVDLVLEEFAKIGELQPSLKSQVAETGNCRFPNGGGAYIRRTLNGMILADFD